MSGLNRYRGVEKQPLVSIGIPTYNRPEGLRRTLRCITSQTYKNIEIIISDNCSPGQSVKAVVEEFMQYDRRISYFRQNVSLGVDGNFKFVLGKAEGKYFMWAADDDEWAEEFIEQCMKILLLDDDVVSVMSQYEISYRFEGRKELGRIPPLSVERTTVQNAIAFLNCVAPTLFYGVHKRDKIDFFLHDDFFEFYDCYVVLRLILTGRVAVVDSCLYTAGVDAPTYQVKPAGNHCFTRLRYSPLLFNGVRQIFSSSMNMLDKLLVMFKLVYVVFGLFFFHEIKGAFK